MARKRPSRKKRGSRSIKSNPGAEQRTEDRSFGSGLDEIGFRPLGRRILVPGQRPQGERAKTTLGAEEQPPAGSEGPVPTADDPLGHDTRDPSWVRRAAEHALSGADNDAIDERD